MLSAALRLLAVLRDRTPEMLALTEQLVNIDSRKPGGDQITTLLADRLAGLGLAIARATLADRGDRVMAGLATP